MKSAKTIIECLAKASSTDEIANLEGLLNQARSRSPDSFLSDVLGIIISNEQPVPTKQLAVSQIRQSVSEFSESTSKVSIKDLSKETVSLLQETLVKAISQENNSKLRIFSSETLGEVGATLFLANRCFDLVPLVWALFEQQKLEVQESAFIVLRILMKYCHQTFSASENIDAINLLIGNGLTHSTRAIRVEAIRSLGVVLEQFERKQCERFGNLSLPLLECVYGIILEKNQSTEKKQQEDSNAVDESLVLEMVGVLCEICESEATFFKPRYNEFQVAIQRMVEQADSPQVQQMALNTLVTYLENIPESLANNLEGAENVLHLILLQMLKIDMNPDEEWLHPSVGFSEELQGTEREETIKFGLNMLNSLISAFSDISGFENNELLDVLLSGIQKMMEECVAKNDSRYGYIAMMALSQVGEFMDGCENLQQLLNTAYKLTYNHQSPLMRYSFAHVIGQISDDLAPLFQEVYGEDLLPKMIALLQDPVPRVRAHACAALINFLESMVSDTLQPHLSGLIDELLRLAKQGIPLEREMAVSALSSAIQTSGAYFERHLDAVIKDLLSFLDSNDSITSLQGFCGNVLECIALISQTQRKTSFLPYLNQITSSLQRIAEASKPKDGYPSKHIFNAWNRIVRKFSQELSSSISVFLPQLLNLVNEVLGLNEKGSSLDVEEVQAAIKMLSIFAEQFQALLLPYIDDIFEKIASLCQSKNEQIRESACRCLGFALRCAKTDGEKLGNLLPEVVKTLREAIEKEHEASLIVVQLECMANCIKEGDAFMSDMEFEFLCHSLMRVLQASDARKAQFKNQLSNSETTEIERQLLPREYKQEEQLHVAVARVIGSIYRSHPEKALTFSASIYTNIAPRAFQDSNQVLLVQFGMILLQDIVKYIGFGRFYQKWEEIIGVFLAQLTHQALLIRKEAFHGLSSILLVTPSQILYGFLPQIRDAALDIINHPDSPDFQQLHDYATDILGKLLKLHGSLLPDDQELTKLWISCLPITREKLIADDQHQIYLQYLVIQIPNIQHEDQQQLLRKFQLLAEFYNPVICTPFMKPTLDSFIREIMENQLIAQAYKQLADQLTKTQQKRLASAFKQRNNPIIGVQEPQEQQQQLLAQI